MWLRLSDALLLYRVGLMRRGIQRLREMVVMHYTQRGLCHVGGSHFMVHRAKSFLSALSRRVVVHKAAATDYPILDCVANSVRSGVNEATVSSAVPVAVLSQRPPPPPLPPPPNRQLSVDGRPVSNDSQHPPPPPPPPSRHFAVSDGVVMKEVCWRPPPPLTRHFAVPDGTMSIAERARFFEQLPLMQTESLSPNRKVKCDEIANKCYNRDESVGAVDCHEISPSTAKPRRASVLAQLFGSVDTENFDRPANTDCIVENEDPTSAQYHGALGLSDIHTLDKTELSEGSAAAASKPFRRASLLRRRRSSVSFYSKDLFSFDDGKSPNYSELGNDSFCSFEAIPEDVMKTQDEGHLVDKKLAPIKHEADFGYRFL